MFFVQIILLIEMIKNQEIFYSVQKCKINFMNITKKLKEFEE